MLLAGILILGILAIIVFIPHSIPSSSVFPFQIDGGTLLDIDSELHTGTIWGQGFTITLQQKSITPTHLFTITLFNFPTIFISISGLLSAESYIVLSETSCILKVMSSSENRSVIISAPNTDESSFKFLTIGDTQGFTPLFTDMLDHPLTSQSKFILHTGDITPSGSRVSLEIFNNLSKESSIPVYATVGNHDIKENNNNSNYEQYFGKSEYFFNYSNVLFISLNSSTGIFSESSIQFLIHILDTFPTNPKMLFTHIPLFDPRPDENHSLLSSSQAEQVLSLISDKNVKAVISGHIHLFNHTIVNDTHFITSGGGGARLYADPEEGGYHHFTEITFNLLTNDLTVNSVPLTKEPTPTDITIIKGALNQSISLFDLQSEFPIYQGFSSFQNQYDNWQSYGYYQGIKISSLLQIVGGLETDEFLQIEAWDTYKVNYSYSVIYPNSSWLNIQGEMILAYSFNGSVVPSYSDGYRVCFIPPDGGYSNEDCRNTSPPGEGWNIRPSAGYRWLKYIKSLTILETVNT
jgi:3',5'-cyclic AMP phosphodiesterase CpdA